MYDEYLFAVSENYKAYEIRFTIIWSIITSLIIFALIILDIKNRKMFYSLFSIIPIAILVFLLVSYNQDISKINQDVLEKDYIVYTGGIHYDQTNAVLTLGDNKLPLPGGFGKSYKNYCHIPDGDSFGTVVYTRRAVMIIYYRQIEYNEHLPVTKSVLLPVRETNDGRLGDATAGNI